MLKKSTLILSLLVQATTMAAIGDKIVSSEELNMQDISTIFHRDQRSFHCSRIRELMSYYKDHEKEDLKKQMRLEIKALKITGKSSELTWREKVLVKRNISVLEKMLRYDDVSKGLRKLEEKTCEYAETASFATIKGLAWGSNAVVSSVLFPVRAATSFGVGFYSNEVSEGEELTYDVLGPNIFGAAASNLYLNNSIVSAASSNPWLLPLIIAPAVDNEVLQVCRNKNSLRSEEVEFCNEYIGFKQKILNKADYFERLGKDARTFFSGEKQESTEEKITADDLLKDMTELTEDNFCQEMIKIGEKFKVAKDGIQKDAHIEMWKIGANPGRYGIPEIASFFTAPENMLSNPETSIYKNVVISLGPSKWQTESINNDDAYKHYKKSFKKFKKLAKRGRKIFQKSDSIERCEELKRKYKFSYNSLSSVIEEMNNNKIGKALFENDKIKTAFKYEATFFNLFDISNLSWDFIDSGDIETITEVLQSPDVANVILVIHGTEKGKIVDSNYNELPREFFKHISPSIMSLNFFSCYSQNIDRFYKISEGISKGKSYHKLRHLSFVELDESYKYKTGQVPIESFAPFLDAIDDFLSKSVKGNLLSSSLKKDLPSYSTQTCQFYVRDMKAIDTTFSLTLNNNYIGVVRPSDKEMTKIDFDCNFINKGNNSFRLLDINLENDDDITLSSTSFSVKHPELGFQVLFDFKDIRSRRDNSLKGVVTSFEF